MSVAADAATYLCDAPCRFPVVAAQSSCLQCLLLAHAGHVQFKGPMRAANLPPPITEPWWILKGTFTSLPYLILVHIFWHSPAISVYRFLVTTSASSLTFTICLLPALTSGFVSDLARTSPVWTTYLTTPLIYPGTVSGHQLALGVATWESPAAKTRSLYTG